MSKTDLFYCSPIFCLFISVFDESSHQERTRVCWRVTVTAASHAGTASFPIRFHFLAKLNTSTSHSAVAAQIKLPTGLPHHDAPSRFHYHLLHTTHVLTPPLPASLLILLPSFITNQHQRKFQSDLLSQLSFLYQPNLAPSRFRQK